MEFPTPKIVKDPDQTRGSEVVREVRLLGVGQRRVLQVSDRQLDVADLCFRATQLLLDDRDPRPKWDRLEDLAARVREVLGPLDLDFLEADPHTEVVLPRWLRCGSTPGFQRFVRRFLGAAHTDRIAKAFQQDGKVLVVGLRRCLRYLLPVAAAADRCIRVLTPGQQAQIEGVEVLARSTSLELVVRLDSLVTRLETAGVPLDPNLARPSELAELPGPIGEIASSMDVAVSDQSAEILQELGLALTRKVRGARDALEFSADPVSQAAHSLVELIDRMLRDAFESEYVIEWIDRCCPSQMAQLTHLKHGQRLPTTRGRALCFTYAGESPPEMTMFHQLAAVAMSEARSNLQRLKHADSCTGHEREEVVGLLEVVEGSLVLVSRVTWLGVEESALDDLRERLVLVA